jgi:hypothetical protein
MRITTNSVLLASGNYFDFEHPEQSNYTIIDIAHNLSNVCRFVGAVKDHYSVAEHSIRVAALLPAQEQLAGLMHDASEFVTGDCAKPFKNLLKDFRYYEQLITNAINVRFRVGPIPPSVHHADMVLMATERRDLLPPDDCEWPCLDGVVPLPETIEPITNKEAESAFLRAFYEITGR